MLRARPGFARCRRCVHGGRFRSPAFTGGLLRPRPLMGQRRWDGDGGADSDGGGSSSAASSGGSDMDANSQADQVNWSASADGDVSLLARMLTLAAGTAVCVYLWDRFGQEHMVGMTVLTLALLFVAAFALSGSSHRP
eukprot:TRINITY_DN26883_c0_g1_i1.p1 TRINITY_DN26883_c0_g1~~TRINITY_DN26883_c0_g1_i1.p1  ORF type:complete len:161 (+),score=41.29 TRINITY_DN26883_c0_g1_i1:70-483(+)